MKRFRFLLPLLFFSGLFIGSLILTFSYHRDIGRFNWHSEIYSDGAGYYAYLPVTFLYQFDYHKFPPGINDSAGCGFVDHEKKKFVYKYTCGVAVMISPFFASTLLVSEILNLPVEGGFSMPFHRMTDVAAVFYLTLGLFFIWKTLRKYTNDLVRYLVVIFVYAGTNLYFYTIRQPLMSHVYSFCAISGFVYFLLRYTDRKTWKSFIPVAVSASLAILIRPVNGIILLLLFFWDTGSWSAFRERIRGLLSWRVLVPSLAIFLVVFLPQMLSWQYMFGSPLHYAYEGESFANWAHPRLLETWFAPLNGLFLYNPVWIVFVAGTILMIIPRERNGILLFAFFIFVSDVIASWHSWFFGCGYGHRAFIDFLPLCAIPGGILLQKAFAVRTRIPFILLILLMLSMSFYNIRLIYSYSGCFFGSVWDWNRFHNQMRWAGFTNTQPKVFVFTNDFENGGITGRENITNEFHRSYNMSVLFDSSHLEGCIKSLDFYEFALPFPTHADARIYVLSPDEKIPEGRFYCIIERTGQTIWKDSSLFDQTHLLRDQWSPVTASFRFPPEMPWDATITIKLQNPGQSTFCADDMKVKFY